MGPRPRLYVPDVAKDRTLPTSCRATPLGTMTTFCFSVLPFIQCFSREVSMYEFYQKTELK